MWSVEGGRTHRARNFWGDRDLSLVRVSAAHRHAESLDHLGDLLHVADVVPNPGVAGIGTDMPALFGEKAAGKAEALQRG